MMGFIYSSDNGYTPQSYISLLVSASVQLGAFFGQLIFGYLGDIYGRLRIYKIVLLIVLIGIIGSSLSAEIKSGLSVYAVYGMWRIFTGIGFGAVYPATALIIAEYAPTRLRGTMCASLFAMQGFAILIGPLVSLVFLSMFKNSIADNVNNLDNVWRLCIVVGIIPCLITMYLCKTIPETPRYTVFIEGDLIKAENDIQIITTRKKYKVTRIIKKVVNQREFRIFFKRYFSVKENLKLLAFLSVCRFITNIVLYGINWNTENVLNAVGFGSAAKITLNDAFTYNYKYSVGNLILAVMGALPGYWVGVGLIEIMGRKKLQIISFFGLFSLLITLGAAYKDIVNLDTSTSNIIFAVYYTLLQLFLDFGANATVFVVPAEVFPTRIRSTAYGITSAIGKIGALCTFGIFFIKDIGGSNALLNAIYIIFSILMLIGAIISFFMPETKQKTYEES